MTCVSHYDYKLHISFIVAHWQHKLAILDYKEVIPPSSLHFPVEQYWLFNTRKSELMCPMTSFFQLITSISFIVHPFRSIHIVLK